MTSELETRDADIIDIYHGLLKIEETFRISKSDLRTRPAWVLKLRMNRAGSGRTFTTFELLDSLRKYTCSHVGENVYNFITWTT